MANAASTPRQATRLLPALALLAASCTMAWAADMPTSTTLGAIENGKVVHVATRSETVAGPGQTITPRTLFEVASR